LIAHWAVSQRGNNLDLESFALSRLSTILERPHRSFTSDFSIASSASALERPADRKLQQCELISPDTRRFPAPDRTTKSERGKREETHHPLILRPKLRERRHTEVDVPHSFARRALVGAAHRDFVSIGKSADKKKTYTRTSTLPPLPSVRVRVIVSPQWEPESYTVRWRWDVRVDGGRRRERRTGGLEGANEVVVWVDVAAGYEI
jgi:hypothetical protein